MSIDKKNFNLSCPKCGVHEQASITDGGSGWSGSHWGSAAVLKSFFADWYGGGKVEPTILQAICNACGEPAEITVNFGGI